MQHAVEEFVMHATCHGRICYAKSHRLSIDKPKNCITGNPYRTNVIFLPTVLAFISQN